MLPGGAGAALPGYHSLCLAMSHYGVTVTVACMLGWIVQVNVYVPAVGNLMAFESPGEKLTPLAVANSVGAPDAAVKVPDVPVTMMWVPPESAGSLNVTVPPALTVALLPVKLNAPMVIVGPALPTVGDAAVVEVGAGGTGVSVGVAATLLSPQAASVNAKSSIRTSPSLRMLRSPLRRRHLRATGRAPESVPFYGRRYSGRD